jgi:hypothetical protein
MLKYAPGLKKHPVFLIALLLTCTMFFASCSGDATSNASPIPPASQAAVITPIGALVTCLTVNSPSLVKLADGNYKLVDEINNCGGKGAGPLTITTQIDAGTAKHSTNLLGPLTIPAHGKATYQTFTGRTSATKKEIDFLAPTLPPAVITIWVTMNGTLQGEWDGQVTIPVQ